VVVSASGTDAGDTASRTTLAASWIAEQVAAQRIATGPGGPPAVPTNGSGDALTSIS
jgi:hypothetical protein